MTSAYDSALNPPVLPWQEEHFASNIWSIVPTHATPPPSMVGAAVGRGASVGTGVAVGRTKTSTRSAGGMVVTEVVSKVKKK